jgi:hypothetical protein
MWKLELLIETDDEEEIERPRGVVDVVTTSTPDWTWRGRS